ncbi:hypothetical protein Nmel_018564 [Mimus melanotis]
MTSRAGAAPSPSWRAEGPAASRSGGPTTSRWAAECRARASSPSRCP